jgi:predicted NBD/HSP70 family sugar kinase
MTNTPLGNRDLIRSINRSAILNAIKNRRPVGRAEIARLTGLSPATVTTITGDLLAKGLIIEKTPGDSSGGRPPILLDLNPKGSYVVGIKLMEDHADGALTDLEASVIAHLTAQFNDRSPEAVIATLAGLVRDLLAERDLDQSRLIGVGVGLAGVVDFERGVLRRSPFFGWTNLPLRDLLRAQVQAPVSIDNDVNTLTLAEMWFGHCRDQRHFITLTLGRGIGMGMVLNGQLYRGASGGAGEFGHTLVHPDGDLCDCGQRGCLEAYVGDPALLSQARQSHQEGRMPPAADPGELARLAKDGDSEARRILAEAGELLGCAVANLVNLINPGCILISGEGVRYGEWLFEPMQKAVRLHAQAPMMEEIEFSIEPWGDEMWARGAASLVLRDLFEPPVLSAVSSNG